MRSKRLIFWRGVAATSICRSRTSSSSRYLPVAVEDAVEALQRVEVRRVDREHRLEATRRLGEIVEVILVDLGDLREGLGLLDAAPRLGAALEDLRERRRSRPCARRCAPSPRTPRAWPGSSARTVMKRSRARARSLRRVSRISAASARRSRALGALAATSARAMRTLTSSGHCCARR